MKGDFLLHEQCSLWSIIPNRTGSYTEWFSTRYTIRTHIILSDSYHCFLLFWGRNVTSNDSWVKRVKTVQDEECTYRLWRHRLAFPSFPGFCTFITCLKLEDVYARDLLNLFNESTQNYFKLHFKTCLKGLFPCPKQFKVSRLSLRLYQLLQFQNYQSKLSPPWQRSATNISAVFCWINSSDARCRLHVVHFTDLHESSLINKTGS